MKYLIDDKLNYRKILVLFYILIYCIYTTMTSFSYYLPYIFRLCIIITLSLPFFINLLDYNINVRFLWQLGSFVALTTVSYLGYWQISEKYSSFLISLLQFFLPITIISHINELTQQEKKALFVFITMCLIITSITTIIGNIKFPLASRWMATVSGAKVEYKQYNIGGYGFVYALVAFSPLLTFSLVQKQVEKKRKTLIIGILLLFFVCIIQTNYTTAMMLFIICNSIVMIVSNRKKRAFVAILIICILIIANRITIGNWLVDKASISMMRYSTDIGMRISEIGKWFLSGDAEGDMASRIVNYQTSLNSFFNSPFLGTIMQGGEIGGHSDLFDILAEAGVVGVMLYLIILINARLDFRNNANPNIYNVGLILFIALLFMALFHTVMTSTALSFFVFIPPLLIDNSMVEKPIYQGSKCKYIQ